MVVGTLSSHPLKTTASQGHWRAPTAVHTADTYPHWAGPAPKSPDGVCKVAAQSASQPTQPHPPSVPGPGGMSMSMSMGMDGPISLQR